jgi:hypothetical protein
MTAERAGNSFANNYENPFADLPAYEEMRQQQNNQKEQAPAEQAQEQPQEQSERRIVHRQAIKTGERSTIYKLEMSDGKEGTEVDSYYIDATSDFKKQHEELKKNFDISLAMAGFSTDLAIVDATRGDCYMDANPAQQKELLADYSKLRSFLESPTANPTEKQLVAEYLGKMQGNAYNFIENQYEQNVGANEQNEKIKAEIEELKEIAERRRDNYEEAYGDYEKAAKIVDNILQDSRYYDELPVAINKLKRAIEDAIDATKSFRNANNDYGNAVMHSRSHLDEETYMSHYRAFDTDDDTIKQALKALDRADDYAHDLGRKVDALLYN